MPAKNPTACLLVIGNEVLSGRTQDANINFIAFNRFLWPDALGQTIVLFSIALAAAEAAVILAVVVVAYRLHDDVDMSELKNLGG